MKKIRVGIAGLGRLGKVHAANIAYKIPNAELTAACSIVPAELDYAKSTLGVADVYADYREMLSKAAIDAVAIVTTSSEHCWQIEAALDAGKHVFSEKPLGVDVAQCKQAEAAVERHPDLTFMLGFMRRYDKSYAYAKRKIDAGVIGTPYLVKATGVDPEALVEGAIRFAKTSGGIFLDMAIHDIDLCRWFLGSEATEVYALGATFKHPEFKDAGDDETGVAVYKFANGGMAMVHVGRTAPYGYHVETEIIGTEGSIRISAIPEKNQAQLYVTGGVVTECVGSFPERFQDAYLTEMEEFIDCVITGRKPGVSVYDGTNSTAIGYATTEAWKTGKIVKIG
ncbi:MAG: Gfo/Idh/MocA family oxidoreductase [Oscillospiraceae bacterium]|nr:Gfo/Idh/MocA family oxidoreductase [Oscillospiraceae bacterium]